MRLIDKIAAVDTTTFTRAGALVVTDPEEIDKLTAGRPDPFKEQSAFFKTYKQNPLPQSVRSEMRKLLIRLLMSTGGQAALKQPAIRDGVFKTQEWGVEVTFDSLLDIICGNRDRRLIDLTRRYIREVVIASNIRGVKKARRPQVSASIWKLMEPYFAELEPASVPRDLVDITLTVRASLDEAEVPEVYSRLVLSMVGFTGVALESALHLGLKRSPDGSVPLDTYPSSAIVNETLRLYPSAWKLIRESHSDATESEYREVLLMMTAVHRNPRMWNKPLSFVPQRWLDQPAPSSVDYFPFGKHNMLCPAKQFALTFLSTTLESIQATQSVSMGRHIRGPRAHILFAPPRRTITIAAKSMG